DARLADRRSNFWCLGSSNSSSRVRTVSCYSGRMSRLQRKPRYVLHARTVGTKTWTCVLCGTINRTTVNALTFKIRCTERSCRARFAFGEVFSLFPGGGLITPPWDRTIPAFPPEHFLIDSLPVGMLASEPYRRGGLVNRLILVDADEES